MSSLGLYLNCLRRRLLYDVTNPRTLVMNLCPKELVSCFGFGYVEFLKLYQCSCLTASMDRSVQADCSRSFRIRWMAVGVVINEITSCGFCELLRVVSQLPAKETALRCHKPTHFSDEPVPEGVSALLWFWLCRVSKTLPMLVPDCFNGSISASRL